MAGTLGATQYEANAVVNNEISGLSVNAVVIADPNANLLSLSSDGRVPVSASSLAPTVVVSHTSGTQSSSNTGESFSTSNVSEIIIDVTVTSFSGGIAPAITFFLQRQTGAGTWYNVWSNTSPIGGAATISASIGPGFSGGTASSGNGGFSVAFLNSCQFGWSTTGSPTSWTGSVQVATR